MRLVAIKMLLGDRAKYIGLIFGMAIATLLMSQQISIFIGIMERASSTIISVTEPDIWVMDPRVRFSDEIEPMRAIELTNVRSVTGVEWAVPFYKGNVTIRLPDGVSKQVQLIGVDDVSLVGICPNKILGDPLVIRSPETAMLDMDGYSRTWPKQPLSLGKYIEVNDHRLVVNAICKTTQNFFTFPMMYTSYTTAMEIIPPQRNQLSFVLVKAQPGVELQELKKRIHEQTGLQALTDNEFMWRSINYYIENTGIPINFGVTILLGALVGAAITAQTFYLFVIENAKQFAAMKAIGVTNKQILKIVLTQAAIVGFIGYSLGITSTTVFFEIMSKAPDLRDILLKWQVMVGSAAAVMVITLMAIFVSLRKVFKLDPAIVFRG